MQSQNCSALDQQHIINTKNLLEWMRNVLRLGHTTGSRLCRERKPRILIWLTTYENNTFLNTWLKHKNKRKIQIFTRFLDMLIRMNYSVLWTQKTSPILNRSSAVTIRFNSLLKAVHTYYSRNWKLKKSLTFEI